MGEKLELNLSLRNVQSEPVVGELTFHTYLRLYDLTATDLSGLAGGEYIDNEPGATRAKQEHELKVAGSCDRIFTTGEAGNVVRVRDSGNRRTIVVTKYDAPTLWCGTRALVAPPNLLTWLPTSGYSSCA